MAGVRTQIYLTEEQRARLEALMKRDGKSLAELVREAIDAFLGSGGVDPQEAMASTFGADPDFRVPPRAGWRRRGEPAP